MKSQLKGTGRKPLSPGAAAKLKREVALIGTHGTRQGFKFAQRMFELYPELKDA
jgi:hypothetical protein